MLGKLFLLIFFGLTVFLWNKYAVVWLVKTVSRMNGENSPITRNKSKIIKVLQGFYWVGFVFIAFGIMFGSES